MKQWRKREIEKRRRGRTVIAAVTLIPIILFSYKINTHTTLLFTIYKLIFLLYAYSHCLFLWEWDYIFTRRERDDSKIQSFNNRNGKAVESSASLEAQSQATLLLSAAAVAVTFRENSILSSSTTAVVTEKK